MLIIFYLLSNFEFAFYLEWDEKLRTYEIGNESEIASWNKLNQKIVLRLGIGWPLLSC